MTEWPELKLDVAGADALRDLVETHREAICTALGLPTRLLDEPPSSYALAKKTMQPRIGGKEASFVAIDEAQESHALTTRADRFVEAPLEPDYEAAWARLGAHGVWRSDFYYHGCCGEMAQAICRAFRGRNVMTAEDVVQAIAMFNLHGQTIESVVRRLCEEVLRGSSPRPGTKGGAMGVTSMDVEMRRLCSAFGAECEIGRPTSALVGVNEQLRQMMVMAEAVGTMLGIARDRWKTLRDFFLCAETPIRGLQADLEGLRRRVPPTTEEAMIEALENLVEGDEDYHALFVGYEGAEGSLYDCAPQRTVFSAHVEIIREDDAENDYPFSASVIPMDPPGMTDKDRAVSKAEGCTPYAALAARRRHLSKLHARRTKERFEAEEHADAEGEPVSTLVVNGRTVGTIRGVDWGWKTGQDLPVGDRQERTAPPGRPIGPDLPGSWPDSIDD